MRRRRPPLPVPVPVPVPLPLPLPVPLYATPALFRRVLLRVRASGALDGAAAHAWTTTITTTCIPSTSRRRARRPPSLGTRADPVPTIHGPGQRPLRLERFGQTFTVDGLEVRDQLGHRGTVPRGKSEYDTLGKIFITTT